MTESFFKKIKSKYILPGKGARSDSQALHPANIADTLKTVVEDKKKIFKDFILVPDNFNINISPDDFSSLTLFIDSVKEELASALKLYIERKNYKINGSDIIIEFTECADLKPGSFKVDALFSQNESVYLNTESDLNENPASSVQLKLWPDTFREKILHLSDGTYVLGRDKTADIMLPDDNRTISKRHCEINISKGSIVVRDLGSTNGTTLNGDLLTKEESAASGSRLIIGNTEIEVVI